MKKALLFGFASMFLLIYGTAFAGFASKESFLPAVGRIAGQGGSQFFTTVWATNLTGVPVTFKFEFLKQGQANPTPASFSDTLAAGETKTYENVVENKLGLINALGAAHVVSTGDVLVAERIFNQPPGTDLGDTEGLFFSGVPKTLSISLGQSASIQGLNQGGAENFRYNFALVETGGGSPTVNVQVFDGGGTLLGQRAFPLLPFEQLQPNVADVVPGFSSIDARLTATVTAGSGSVLLAGAQVANLSQDSSGFEMSFRDDLLGGGGTAGVTSLNALTGALTLTPGNGISITPSGSSIAIAFTGGGSSGLTSITHDATLKGDGTGGLPLGIAVPLAVSTSAAGSAVVVSSFTGTGIQGNASSGGGTFGVEGTADGTSGISTASTNSGVLGDSSIHFGVVGLSGTGTGILAQSVGGVGLSAQTTSGNAAIVGHNNSVAADAAGILGTDGTGSSGQTGSLSAGVRGESSSHIGVEGLTKTGVAAVRGLNSSTATDTAGVFGRDGTGLSGFSGTLSAGVRGESAAGEGVVGASSSGGGVLAISRSGFALLAGDTAGLLDVTLVEIQDDLAILANGDVLIDGNQKVTGTKSFVEPHPTDRTKEIRFVCLEGPESGTYFRGTGHVVGGFAKIEVPEAFRDVSDEKGLTVVATAVGGPGSIWVVRKGLDQIVLQANSDVEFDYVVNGVRKAYRDFQVIRDNESFIPGGPDDRRFAHYAPEIQRRLVATGIYNGDGTVNLETARRLGWDKRWKTATAVTANEDQSINR